MTAPIKGSDGALTLNRGTINEQRIIWAGEWETTVKQNKQEFGPHIGDPKVYPVGTSVVYEFSIKGTIPKGGDAALRVLRARAQGGTGACDLDLQAYGGERFAFASSTLLIEQYKSALKADGSHTFEVSGSGPAVITESPL
jgi:hypothetical protein